MVKKHTTLHKNIEYWKNDKVLVRTQGSSNRKLGSRQRHVVKGTIVKKGKNSYNNQFIVQMPYKNEKEKNGFLQRTLST